MGARSNADVEAQIAHLRAELLHKEQENERVQAALAREVEERERAERQVGPYPGIRVLGLAREVEDRERAERQVRPLPWVSRAGARGGGAQARRAAGEALAQEQGFEGLAHEVEERERAER